MKTTTREKEEGAGTAAAVTPEEQARAHFAANGGAHPGTEEPAPPAPRPRPRRPFGVMDVVWFLPRLVTRIFFPKLLDRYVIGEMLGPLFFGWTLFIVLFVFSLNLFKLAKLAAAGAPVDTLGEMLVLRVVLASVYCLPMAMLLAGLMAFGRLSGDSELIATQAGGISNLRSVRNAFLIGLALSVLGLWMNEYVLPPAGKRLNVLEAEVKAALRGRAVEELTDQKAFIIQDQENGRLARLVAARKFEPENPPYPAILREVTYIQYDKGVWNTIVSAKRAEWVGEKQWRFIDANTQFRDAIVKGQRINWQQDELILRLNKNPKQVEREKKDPDQMTYRELSGYIREMKAQGIRKRQIRELEVELERKLAIPFAALVFATIGAPLGIRRQRSTAGVGIGLSLLIIIGYYVGMSFLGALALDPNGSVGPLEAAWGCNVVGLLAGLFLTWRTSR